jgi:Cu/Ag efflux protein CusF
MKPFQARLVGIVFACCFLLFLSEAPTFAAAKKKLVAPPDRRYLVKSVDAKTNSITIFSSIEKTSHTYHVDDMTTVQVDGASAKFASIKAGMEVSAFTERDADDLDSVNLNSKTSAPVAVDPTKPVYTGSVSTIESVLPDNNTVVIHTAQTNAVHTYRVDDNTALKVNGIPGKFADIKAGMTVTDFTERDNDDLDSLTVMGGYDDSTPTPAKKKK